MYFNKRNVIINISVACNTFVFLYNTYIQKFCGYTVNN